MKTTFVPIMLVLPILQAVRNAGRAPNEGFIVSNPVSGTVFICREMPSVIGKSDKIKGSSESWLLQEGYIPVVSPVIKGQWIHENIYGNIQGMSLEIPKPLDSVILYSAKKSIALLCQLDSNETWEGLKVVLTERLENL